MSREALCDNCGKRMTYDVSDMSYRCPTPDVCRAEAAGDLAAPTFTKQSDNIVVDPKPSFTAGLGPIRLSTREEVLEDARRGRWQPMPCPEDRPSILTRDSGRYGGWLLARYRPGTQDTTYLHGRPATHWAEDTIGSPVA